MARFVKQLGQVPIKYQVNVYIESFCFQVPYDLEATFYLKRSEKIMRSSKKVAMSKGKVELPYNDNIQMITTMVYDKKAASHRERTIHLMLDFMRKDATRSVALLKLPIHQYIDQPSETRQLKFDKAAGDPEAWVKVKVTCSKVGAGDFDTLSMMSDAVSMMSAADNPMNFQSVDEAMNAPPVAAKRKVSIKRGGFTGLPPTNSSPEKGEEEKQTIPKVGGVKDKEQMNQILAKIRSANSKFKVNKPIAEVDEPDDDDVSPV